MTVTELIQHLQQFDGDTRVMMEYTDHTDWTSKWDIDESDIELGDNMCDDDNDEDEQTVLLFNIPINVE